VTSRQEAQWVLRAQVGDREAIEALLGAVQPLLTRYVRAIVGAADAEDVSQDVLVLIYRKLWMLTTPDLFRPWMYRIATRAAFQHVQKGRRWPNSLREDEALDELPTQDLAAMAPRVDELLQDPRLTPASRAVLALHFKEEMTLAEVAAVLDLPLGTVKSRLAYGLAALRRHYAGENND
jgi:RNA polymerase sigma-70 factor (ECF subfamily)